LKSDPVSERFRWCSVQSYPSIFVAFVYKWAWYRCYIFTRFIRTR